MIRSFALARAVGGATLAGALLLAFPAAAQTTPDCSTLPNPVYFTGSSAFDPTVGYFAVKLAALGTPITLVYNPTGSCTGVATIAGNSDLTGSAHSYMADATTGAPVNVACNITGSTKTDIAVSDVFWGSCSSAPTQPSTIMDYLGPAQAMEFVVPETSTVTDISYEEAQLVYGCGAAGAVSPFLSDAGIFSRDMNSGTQIIISKSIGLSPSLRGTGTTGSGDMLSKVTGFASPTAAIGFLAADFYDKNRTMLNALAFRAKEQTKAYTADSNAGTTDKRNVRDGHYIPWGYEHLLAMPTNQKAVDVIGYITGKKTDASFDYVERTASAKTIPLCAMKVARTADGGDLSFATRTDTCDCAYEAFATSSTPTGCTTCDSTHPCTGSLSCHHGYCE